MKRFYLVFGVLIAALTATGQTSIVPTSVTAEGFNASDFEAVGYTFVTNNGPDSVEYTWTRNVIEITEGWTSAVCDKNNCYFDFVSTQSFILGSDSVSNLDVHLYPNGVEGSALIEVAVVDDSNSENFVVGQFIFSTSTLSTDVEKISNNLKIYPNPAVSQVFIENANDVQRVEFFDISGKKLKEVTTMGNLSVDVSDLPSGNYIVRMWNASNAQISTNILSIQ